MTHSEKLAAILAVVQTDPGKRGLARDPDDNLFTATAGDFEAACRSVAADSDPRFYISTGFYIPNASPPGYETDGPLGALFFARAMHALGIPAGVSGMGSAVDCAIFAGLAAVGLTDEDIVSDRGFTHMLAVEHGGPGRDGRYRTMRGHDITPYMMPTMMMWWDAVVASGVKTIGIGDGGNEIGMGKIPHETIVKNIPNGDLIHCRVPTDHLIVAGVSNWGAYALAAGLFVLLDREPPADLFDPDRELAILEAMVRDGPLVDGVTGKQTATVDGLTWEEYGRPLLAIQRILDS